MSLLEAQASELPCVISENVSKESVIFGLCKFVSIDNTKETADAILSLFVDGINNRNNLDLDTKYDSKRTSEELFEFYRNNLVR